MEPGDPTAFFKAPGYAITLDLIENEKVYEVGLKSSKDKAAIIFLDYLFEYPDQMPYLTFLNYHAVTELLEEVSDLWAAGSFHQVE